MRAPPNPALQRPSDGRPTGFLSRPPLNGNIVSETCLLHFSGAAIDAVTFDGADLAGAKVEGAGAYGYTYGEGECPGLERPGVEELRRRRAVEGR